MAVGLNKIMVIGNLGTDPEMKYTPNGKAVTTFRLATNRTYRGDDGEQREETEWFTVVAWDKLAEQVNQYLTKGRRAYIEGRFRSRRWESQDGQPRSVNEIIASSVLFLDQGTAPGDSTVNGGDAEGALEPDDLPF
ncbi:MAG: single-stranded DNA-binding protein [Dehalococcoidia bacterium]|nr:single-stranded DNA-binding protein [Chloroflexota bacterium]